MKVGKPVFQVVITLVTVTAVAIGYSGTSVAVAEGVDESSSVVRGNASTFNVPEWYTVEDVEAELDTLASLSESEQDRLIREGLGLQPKTDRIAPFVIVAAIGCAVGAGGALFNTNWSSASSVAWSLAGALVSCIPGTSQAKLVSVIMKHRKLIARALAAVGATAAAAALGGDSAN